MKIAGKVSKNCELALFGVDLKCRDRGEWKLVRPINRSEQMPIEDGKNTINALLTAPRIDKCIVELILTARERAKQFSAKPGLQTGKVFGVPGCSTEYGPGNLELDTWFLSLYFAEYTAGILAQKTREGHCNEHRKAPDFKRCPMMAQEHLAMLAEFKAALVDLVSQIDAAEKELQAIAPPPKQGP